MHLRVSLYDIKDHAQIEMKKHGITYQYATPQSIGDQWWFWNCENIPDPLPKGFSILKIEDPFEYVGFGISKETAVKIRDYKKICPSMDKSQN